METILLVEDKAELREMLVQALSRMHYDVVSVGTAGAAIAQLGTRNFSAVLTDLKLPSGTGMDVLQAALAHDDALPVIIMTAYGTIAEAVAAMRLGAYDFIQKPIDLDHLEHLLRRAIERQQLLRENLVLKEEYARHFGFPRIVGEHETMRAIGREIQAIAATDTTVLLLGASGTGKELIARAIHRLGRRTAKPFLALNCAAIPEPLIENELFGHEKGAFTGADSRQAGKFERASHGTLFLDEIGELPPGVQAKLLRVLEGGKLQRLGATAETSVDVRVIAATNRNLEEAIRQKQFREDLYYRLAVFTIRIPALRERGEDVILLAEHFLDGFRREFRKPKLRFTQAALSALRDHDWPGNVRELQNVIERAAILGEGELSPTDLGLTRSESKAAAASAGGASAGDSARERRELEQVLRDCKWDKKAAAARLGIGYKALLNKLRAYELN